MASRMRLFVANDGPTLRLSPELAEEIGLERSLVLLQIDFLISIYGKKVTSEQDPQGRLWVFYSIRALQSDFFPFLSVATISRTLTSLVNDGLLALGRFNKHAYDKTGWYTIGPKIEGLRSIRYLAGPTRAVDPQFGHPRKEEVKEPKKKTKPAPKADDKEDLSKIRWEAAQALAEVCRMDFELNRSRLLAEAKLLDRTAAEIRELFGPEGSWYLHDFRGQKGSPPYLPQIKETWNRLVAIKAKTTPQAKADDGGIYV